MINHFSPYNTEAFTPNSQTPTVPDMQALQAHDTTPGQPISLRRAPSTSLLPQHLYNSADESDDENLTVNSISSSSHSDSFRHFNDRMENRVNKMFRPFQQQRKTGRFSHFHSPNCHHRNSPSCPCARNFERQNYNRANQVRSNKRDELRLGSRGSMEEFVLKQEESHFKRNLEVQAELQHINELAHCDSYSDDDNDYDADYDDDYLNKSQLSGKRRSRSPSHRIHHHPHPHQQQQQRVNYHNQQQYHPHDESEAQNELEQMLDLERLEIEEMTKNLSLEDT